MPVATDPTNTATDPANAPVFNQAQRVLLKTYDDGYFAHILDHKTNADVLQDLGNDGLLRFLFVELSTAEGCDDIEDAEDRISTALRQLQSVYEAISLTSL